MKNHHVLIIVENLPLPFDRRVWQEANTLKENGFDVSIICPKMKGYTSSYEKLNGIDIYRHSLPTEASGALGYLIEYSLALFWEFILSVKIFIKKPFQIIQACNPPDLIFLVALPFRFIGVKFVFDHHDINPELYIAKYNKKGLFYRFLLMAEKLTFNLSTHSIATNHSYRQIAIERGGMAADKVTVVRSGPKLDRLKIQPEKSIYKKGRKHLIGYVGVIGEQEGMDLLLSSVEFIVRQRDDIQFAIVGSGTVWEKIKALCSEMNLDNFVDFYGRVSDELMVDILNTADVCVNPDRPTVMNDLSTMNKIMEYMGLKKPIVQYDLKEGRFSALEASLYAKNTDVEDFAKKIIYLIDNPVVAKQMGEFGYNRVLNELSWEHESKKYLKIYQDLIGSYK